MNNQSSEIERREKQSARRNDLRAGNSHAGVDTGMEIINSQFYYPLNTSLKIYFFFLKNVISIRLLSILC